MPQASSPARRPGQREMVAMLAALMAMNAFAIDAMLPALPAIGHDLGVSDSNHRQLVIVAYFLGFGSTQLLWGPLADRFGRKPVLAAGIALYATFAGLCSVATSFPGLIAARIAMGASAAVTRVLVTAMVRDLYEGAAMARVMSLVFMVFMVVPVLAPSIGQLMLHLGPWRLIFWVLTGYGVLVGLWSHFRLPETLHAEFRRPLNFREVGRAMRVAATNRLSLGYTLAMSAVFAGLTGYISSIQQVVFDVFHRPAAIGLVFAAIAGPMSLASWANSRIVGRLGLRPVSHAALIALVLVSTGHALYAGFVGEGLWTFVALMGLSLACFAFTSASFGTLAMSQMAEIAGTASAVQGVVGNVAGAVGGLLIGQSFDGTQRPFLFGFAGFAMLALLAVLVTERGRLLRDPVPSAD